MARKVLKDDFKPLAYLLAASLACPASAVPGPRPDVVVSSGSAQVPHPLPFRPVFQGAAASDGRSTIGIGVGLKEGKPLEMLLWSGAGAVTGSIAGPLGTVVGAAAGAAVGLFISVFVVPRTNPELPPQRVSVPSSR